QAFSKQFNEWAKQGQTPVYIARDNQLLGVLTITDPIRQEAKEVINWLTKNHIKSTIITGDHPLTAQYVADKLGIVGVYAQTKPDDKASIVKMLQAQDGLTAFVGDGIHDAHALAQSDIGVASRGGTELALQPRDRRLLGHQ